MSLDLFDAFASATGTASLFAWFDGAPAAAEPPRLDPVQLVLVAFSLMCWLVIGLKALHVSRANAESRRFVKAFDAADSFEGLAKDLAAYRGSPFARIFATGY